MLECGDGTLYTGITDDLERRLRAHREGKGAKYTRGRGPLILRYRETVPDKRTALKRECEIKRMRKNEKMAMISEKERNAKSLLAFSQNEGYTGYSQERAEGPGREEEKAR